jgi:hypothetical protein
MRSIIPILLLTLGLPTLAEAVSVSVPGYADPWLAGMPPGTIASAASGFDSKAPDHSPILVPGLTLAPGNYLTFAATGAVKHGAITPLVGPDGSTGLPPSPGDPAAPSVYVSHVPGPEHGMSDVTAPIDALMGVFLAGAAPDLTPAPSPLSFLVGDLDFPALSPLLKQVFYVGNGATSGGATQSFFVPAGATRLYLGTMDSFGWSNNDGAFLVEVTEFVPEPTGLTLALLAMAGGIATRLCWRRATRLPFNGAVSQRAFRADRESR